MSKETPQQPAYYRRRKKRGNEICQILIRNGDVKPEHVRKALAIQEEKGGQIGRILVQMRATTEQAVARALLAQLQLREEQGENDISKAARDDPAIAGLKITCSPRRTVFSLVLTDLSAFQLAAGIGVLVDYVRTGELSLEGPLLALLAVPVCVVVFAVQGLYKAMAPSPPDELSATTTSIWLVFLGVAAFSFFGERTTAHYSIARRFGTFPSLVAWCVIATFVVPIARAALRSKLAHRAWWGHPVIVLGASKTGRLLVKTLRAQPSCGLKPVMLLDDDPRKHGTLRANWTNETMDVRSFHVASSDLVSDSMRRASSDLVPDSMRRAASDLLPESVRRGAQDLLGPPAAELPKPDSSRLASNEGQEQAARQLSSVEIDSLPEFLSGAPESTRHPGKRAPAPVKRARGMFAEVEGVPIVGDLSLAPILARRLAVDYAIVAMPGVSSRKLVHLTERVGGVFSHILVIPDLFGFATLGVPAKNVGGVLGIEVRQQLLLAGPRLAKRTMDVVLTGLGVIAISPILLALALLIKLDSRGPVLYFQERLGRDGRRFRAAKFRSMHGDGEARLKVVLENDPKLRAEYDEFHKLTNDPRVTRIGRVIRKYSLDELPQLWNVIRGDMSLVGPRPYLEREIPDMNQQEKIILRAMPGMTGMWQVSDRNSTGFDARVAMDIHYVRNWSPWLDIYILARTFGVVIAGTGV